MTLPFYPFYWSDYNAKTIGLTQGQNGAYILLLKYYYCTGRRVMHEQRYSIASALLEQERSDTDLVLNLFFKREGNEWVMPRAEEVVAEWNAKHEKRVNAGKTPKTPSPEPISNAQAMPQQPEPEPIKERKKEPTVLSKEKRGTRLPDNFEPDESCHQLAESLLLTNKESQDALDNFLDYWRAVPGAKGLKLNWQMTFKNQLRHVAKQKAKSNGRNGKTTRADAFAILDAVTDEAIRREGRWPDSDEADPVELSGLRQSAA